MKIKIYLQGLDNHGARTILEAYTLDTFNITSIEAFMRKFEINSTSGWVNINLRDGNVAVIPTHNIHYIELLPND